MKCPNCGNKKGRNYLLCSNCITEILNKKINFHLKNIPKSIDTIVPSVVIDEMNEIMVKDLNESLQALKNHLFTASITMSCRLFEGFIWDYFDEDYLESLNTPEEESVQNDDTPYQRSIFPQLVNISYGINQWNFLTGKNNVDQEEKSYPHTLGGRLSEISEFLSDSTNQQFEELRNIRNEAMHGVKVYNDKEALMVFKTILKFMILAYNGSEL